MIESVGFWLATLFAVLFAVVMYAIIVGGNRYHEENIQCAELGGYMITERTTRVCIDSSVIIELPGNND